MYGQEVEASEHTVAFIQIFGEEVSRPWLLCATLMLCISNNMMELPGIFVMGEWSSATDDRY
jgi:hypothetical protein